MRTWPLHFYLFLLSPLSNPVSAPVLFHHPFVELTRTRTCTEQALSSFLAACSPAWKFAAPISHSGHVQPISPAVDVRITAWIFTQPGLLRGLDRQLFASLLSSKKAKAQELKSKLPARRTRDDSGRRFSDSGKIQE